MKSLIDGGPKSAESNHRTVATSDVECNYHTGFRSRYEVISDNEYEYCR